MSSTFNLVLSKSLARPFHEFQTWGLLFLFYRSLFSIHMLLISLDHLIRKVFFFQKGFFFLIIICLLLY